MELCCATAAPRGLSSVPAIHHRPPTKRMLSRPPLPFLAAANHLFKGIPISGFNPGLRLSRDCLPRYTTSSEDASSAIVKEEPRTAPDAAEVREVLEERVPNEGSSVIECNEVPLPDQENDPLDFLKNLDIKVSFSNSKNREETVVGNIIKSDIMPIVEKLQKFDAGETYSVLAYGTGTFLTLWLSSAVVGALDSLPLLPKLMEIIGLGYTIWFSYRYLIFKENRDELFAKIEDLKEQIVGPSE